MIFTDAFITAGKDTLWSICSGGCQLDSKDDLNHIRRILDADDPEIPGGIGVVMLLALKPLLILNR